MRMSASRMGMWMKCSLMAKFRYVDHLPTKRTSRMTFGICVHAALEQYNIDGDGPAAVALFTDLWDNPEKINATPEVWPKGTTHGGFREKGIEVIKTYHEKQGWESRIILAQEHKFLVPMGKHELQGVVDLLEIRKSGRGKNVLRIVDYKTGSKQPYKTDLRLNLQFTIYDYASRQKEFWVGNGPDYPPLAPNGEELWEKYKDMPRRGIYFHLLGCKEIDAGERDEIDFMRLYRAVSEIARADELKVYVPCISGETCHFCDFTEPCGVRIPEQQYSDDENFF